MVKAPLQKKSEMKNSPYSLLLFFFLMSMSLFSSEALSAKHLFIENKGQVLDQNHQPNTDVLFLYSGSGLNIQLRRGGFSYEVFNAEIPEACISPTTFKQNLQGLNEAKLFTHRVDFDFYGAAQEHGIIKEQASADYLNYVVDGLEIGFVRGFKKVTYLNVFKNTDIEFILSDNANKPLKYNVILHPGADPKQIKFLIKGADQISKNIAGDLLISTQFGQLHESIPFSYYTSSPSVNEPVGFKLQNKLLFFDMTYDDSKTLIIDPSSNLIWSTYCGGAQLDFCNGTASDNLNNVYVAGYCLSTSNMATSGAFQFTLTGSFDAYLEKFNAAGQRVWGTYFGGTGVDVFYAIKTAPNGIIYLSGDSFSTSNIATPGAHQTVYGGGIDDAILVKFNSAGQRLWATYMGGTQHDIAQALCLDKIGNKFITGHTESPNAIATVGAYRTAYVLNYDVFITKFDSTGVRLWGTYYGDSGVDEAYGIGCDTTGAVYVTGGTQSTAGISTIFAQQLNCGGAEDAFVAKFNASGTALLWGTYYGGGGNDFGTALEVSRTGTLFMCGTTTSSNNIASAGAYHNGLASADDAFIMSMNDNGQRLWATYFGGNDVDYIHALTLDPNNNLVFCGATESTDSIATTGAFQTTINGLNNYDAYFAKFTSDGKRKLASYFGGPANDTGKGICLDNTGKLYMGGETSSTVNIATSGAFMTTAAGAGDLFLAKFCITPEPKLSPAGHPTLCAGTLTVLASTGYSTYLWTNASTVNPLVITTTTSQTSYSMSALVKDGYGCQAYTDTVFITTKKCINGLSEVEFYSDLLIYPSPANDYIYIQSTEFDFSQAIIKIYDLSGKEVLYFTQKESDQGLNIQSLNPGLYLLRIHSSQNDIVKTFVKE